MGGALSSPVDESTKREIQELIKSILVTFTTQYVKAYAIYLVKRLKLDAQTQPEDWKLLIRPVRRNTFPFVDILKGKPR
jgi:hypothetical protein